MFPPKIIEFSLFFLWKVDELEKTLKNVWNFEGIYATCCCSFVWETCDFSLNFILIHSNKRAPSPPVSWKIWGKLEVSENIRFFKFHHSFRWQISYIADESIKCQIKLLLKARRNLINIDSLAIIPSVSQSARQGTRIFSSLFQQFDE